MFVSMTLVASMFVATSASAKASTTLTVLTNRTDIVSTDLKKMAADYKAKTGVTINWQAATDYEGNTKVRLNSNNYGDVLLIPNGITNAQLGQYFAPLGKNTDKDIKDYSYNTKKATKNSDGTYTVYGLTYGLGADGIVYNKAALAKAGIKTFPKTLDAWYAAADKLQKAGIVPLATNFKDKWPLSSFDAMCFPEYKNGNYQLDMIKEANPFAADKANGKALEVLYKFVNSGWVEPDLTTTNWEQSKAMIGTGKFAMALLGTWAIPQMQGFATNKNDIGFAAIPVDNSGKLMASTSPDYFMGVSNKSKNIAAAKAFLYYFLNSDFADKQGFIPAKTTAKPSNQVVKDFLSSGVKLITINDDPTKSDIRTKIANDANIDFYGGKYIQDVAIAAKQGKDAFDAAIKDLNDRWEASKKKLGY